MYNLKRKSTRKCNGAKSYGQGDKKIKKYNIGSDDFRAYYALSRASKK